MFNLPKQTEIQKFIPKKALLENNNLSKSDKDIFEKDIQKVSLQHDISTRTTTLAEANGIKSFYIMLIELKEKDFNPRSIEIVKSLINQNVLYVLQYEDEARLAIYHTKLILGDWKKLDFIEINLQGLDLNAVWENLVQEVGKIEIVEENTLEEQILQNAEREKLQAQIARLEKKAWAEKQPKRKFEILDEINKLKNKFYPI